MIELDLYEEINCKRTNVYDKYRHIYDPFFVRVHFNKKLNKWIGNQRRLAKPFGDNSFELTITDEKLLKKISENKNNIVLMRRHIITWGTEKYFIKEMKVSPIFIDNNIVIFEIRNHYKVILEDEVEITVKSIKRDIRLNELFHSFNLL